MDEMERGGIAVLGATGLIGRHVVMALVDERCAGITATCRRRPAFEAPGVAWRQVDLLSPGGARAAMQGVRRAVICAGRVSTSAELRRDPVTSVLETLRIGVNTLEAAAAEKLDQVVLIGSTTAYPEGQKRKEEADAFQGDPPPAWFGVGWVHRFLEKQLEWHAKRLGLISAAVVLRPTLVYGPHDDFNPQSAHFVPSMIRRVVDRESPIEVWGDGSQTRNLIHGRDVASAVVSAQRRPEAYAAYNVASSASASVKSVLSELLALDRYEDAVVTYRRDMPAGASQMDVSSAAFAERYGWSPKVSLREGLAETLDWYRRSQAPAGQRISA
jgi:GDP-L-fucose synthase